MTRLETTLVYCLQRNKLRECARLLNCSSTDQNVVLLDLRVAKCLRWRFGAEAQRSTVRNNPSINQSKGTTADQPRIKQELSPTVITVAFQYRRSDVTDASPEATDGWATEVPARQVRRIGTSTNLTPNHRACQVPS